MKRKYDFSVYFKQRKSDWWIAECPLFDGCFAQGWTLAKARKNIKKMIALCFECGGTPREILKYENVKVSIDEDDLENFVIAPSPKFRKWLEEAHRDIKAGRTIPLEKRLKEHFPEKVEEYKKKERKRSIPKRKNSIKNDQTLSGFYLVSFSFIFPLRPFISFILLFTFF